ncbi:MAG TPA: hypothetical protein VMW72_24790 [Sedimentisphaerales bacterium]|nr:hypothetical protein [Sedimentisphaerales bacterium]
MFRKMIYLVCFVLLLSLVSDVQAVDMTWSDTTGDHLWSTAQNWDTGTVPTSADYPRIASLIGPTIANEGAVASLLGLGFGGGSVTTMKLDGGTLEIITYFQLGLSNGCEATCDMISGNITAGHILVGDRGSGTLNMTGGTITVNGLFRIGHHPTSIGHVNLDSGIINTSTFDMRGNVGAVGTMDVRAAGTLIINGDNVTAIQEYIDSGWISAYDGNGTLQLDYDVTNKGRTTLSATHFLNPNPADGSLVSSGEMELSWVLADPCVPGQAVSVDVYFTDDLRALTQFTDPDAMRIVSNQSVSSVVVQTEPKKQYYWAIDSYIGSDNDPVYGPIFSFVSDNMPPQVDAGVDILTWLGDDGLRTKILDATVTDDSLVSPYTVHWTVISEPNDPNSSDAMITDPSAKDTSITLSAVGDYVLQLEAFDGEYTGSDTVIINVYNDGCEAAQSLPDYVPFPGDLNGDCKVDDLDLAILQEDWLKDNSLTEP